MIDEQWIVCLHIYGEDVIMENKSVFKENALGFEDKRGNKLP